MTLNLDQAIELTNQFNIQLKDIMKYVPTSSYYTIGNLKLGRSANETAKKEYAQAVEQYVNNMYNTLKQMEVE